MADSKELKPKSFRIDDETADKLKELMKNFPNQNIAFQKMTEAFEFQQSKEVLVEKKADLEEFEKYVSCLIKMYMVSLETNQNQKELVRSEFDALLKSKDTTIQDLQEKLTVAKQLKEEATVRAKSHAEENTRLNSVIESLNTEYSSKMDDMQAMLADKDSLNKALTDSCNTLKNKVESMVHDVEQIAEYKKSLEELKQERDGSAARAAALQADLAAETAKHEQSIAELKKHEIEALERTREQSQIALDKALLDLEKKYQEQIQQLKAEKQAEVDKYQQKYFDLLEQIKNQQFENVTAEPIE